MPACTSENVSRFWTSSPPISRSSSLSPPIPSSPLSTSPPLISPISTLKRSVSNVSNSSNTSNISQSSNSTTPTVIFSTRRQQQQQQQQQQQRLQLNHQTQTRQGQNHNRNDWFLLKILTAYIGVLFGIAESIVSVISYVIWAPALGASIWVYMLWVIFQFPLTAFKWFLTVLYMPASERSRNKRCVLISGGSTVQTVHLARNFHKAGARVVICELDGLFGLAKFSTACSKFYTIPKPGPGNAIEYIKALKDIVQKEKAVYYIPVSASNTAYYDALAKPYLEVMGCECFVPGASEVTALDDTLELLERCRVVGLPIPCHTVLCSMQDVSRLYEQNAFATGRYLMLAAGPTGMRDRSKIVLPPTLREFRNQQYEIGENKSWVVIRDPSGKHYITCTTVKGSKVVTNVTCLVDEERGLIPEERAEVSQWLERFFARSFGTRINGHLSFSLAMTEEGELVPISCRVGVSLPYICHTRIHPRLVWKPCRHFSRQNSGILSPSDLLPDAVACALKRPGGETVPHLMGTVLDKREALFTYWDPLPYCAYYHLQLPFRRFAGMLRAQPVQHNPPLAQSRRTSREHCLSERKQNGISLDERRVRTACWDNHKTFGRLSFEKRGSRGFE
ncbi:PREDICTED: uncharacterized protein LOC108579410 isoform X1 [Habropoda laboriosa]|uniref:uncharacterized protein LOC108579410 isoform X1 n=1 Tax=Habropoda laboriosa TaxID=597456 RepID=UPI00083DFEFE|nr:PREDICTED: uncharacterized protein LOC108579410 isoform X1 [Habropoda laboriosa]